MKLEMSTNMMRIIDPGLYETILGDFYNDIYEEFEDEFKDAICKYGVQAICDVLNEAMPEEIYCFSVGNAKLNSPQFYNYMNNWLDFDLYLPDSFQNYMKKRYYESSFPRDKFFKFTREKYGSYSGFISFFPYLKDEFEAAIEKPVEDIDFVRAVAMFIMYMVHESDQDLDYIQRSFIDDVSEYASANGLIDYGEED